MTGPWILKVGSAARFGFPAPWITCEKNFTERTAMTDITAITANEANNVVLAVEAGMKRLRREFAPARPHGARCHACRGRLLRDYIRLRRSDVQGRPIWLHTGRCLARYASLSLRSAEAWRR
jgi:hypothetical protein